MFDAIERIYGAGGCRETWHGILETIPDLCGGEAANLLIANPKTRATTVLSPRTDDGFINQYFNEWFMFDPTFPMTVSAPVGKVITLADTGHETFTNSDFYHDVWKRSGHAAERMRCNIIMNPYIQIGFGVSPYARKDEITDHMRKVYIRLLPHLIRSVEMYWRMHRLELQRTMAVTGVEAGMIVVNSDARILLTDGVADKILSRGAPLDVRKGVLCALYQNDTNALHKMIESCRPRRSGYHLRGGSAEISYPDCPALNLAILPATGEHSDFALDVDANTRPAAIVILEDLASKQASQIKRLCEIYSLTEREAAVALECLKGGTRIQIAKALAMSDATARTHLSRIYEKTGTGRRSVLVRLLQQDGFSA